MTALLGWSWLRGAGGWRVLPAGAPDGVEPAWRCVSLAWPGATLPDRLQRTPRVVVRRHVWRPVGAGYEQRDRTGAAITAVRYVAADALTPPGRFVAAAGVGEPLTVLDGAPHVRPALGRALASCECTVEGP